MQSNIRFKNNRFHHLFSRYSYFFIAVIAPLLSITQTAHSQTLTQTIRGIVVDKSLQTPIAGASIVLVGSQPLRGTTTSTDGDFALPNVPIGRQTLKVTYMGYKESIMSNIVVNAGKELVLTIGLEEDITQLAEITVKPTVEKDKPLNDMATVSARTFSVEETQRYAAAVNDPARMATAYAGVMSADDGGNNIVIRGNSPNGLLWRMEGIDIPNPNHFSSLGASGGGAFRF